MTAMDDRAGITLIAVMAFLIAGSAAAAELPQGPCGAKTPGEAQRRKGGEGVPPLPLPATPQRRTEKKRPPSPPPLAAKIAYGGVQTIDDIVAGTGVDPAAGTAGGLGVASGTGPGDGFAGGGDTDSGTVADDVAGVGPDPTSGGGPTTEPGPTDDPGFDDGTGSGVGDGTGPGVETPPATDTLIREQVQPGTQVVETGVSGIGDGTGVGVGTSPATDIMVREEVQPSTQVVETAVNGIGETTAVADPAATANPSQFGEPTLDGSGPPTNTNTPRRPRRPPTPDLESDDEEALFGTFEQDSEQFSSGIATAEEILEDSGYRL
mgnify:CR=1 FL=1